MSDKSSKQQIVAPGEVHAFWFSVPGDAEFGTARSCWFEKDAAFDAEIRSRFGATIRAAIAGECESWLGGGPRDTLSYIVLLDQFTRNAFRDTAAMYDGDPRALSAARSLVDAGADRSLPAFERWFCYLPFEHAESVELQRRSVALFADLREDPIAGRAYEWAVKHLEVVERFGRFPHRNEILGRATTSDEAEFLRQPGSRF